MSSADDGAPRLRQAFGVLLRQENLSWREKIMRLAVAVALAMIFGLWHYTDVLRQRLGRQPKYKRP
jgi:hypothetical protein